jgi:hypothetical protein
MLTTCVSAAVIDKWCATCGDQLEFDSITNQDGTVHSNWCLECMVSGAYNARQLFDVDTGWEKDDRPPCPGCDGPRDVGDDYLCSGCRG